MTGSPARPTSAWTADLTVDRVAPRASRLSRDAEGWLFGIAGVLAFSFSLPATKVAVPHFGWLIMSLGRAEVAAFLATGVLLARREPIPRRALWLPIVISGLGVIVGFPLLTSIALRDVSAAHGAVVTGLLPAATAVFAVWRGGERPPRAFWGAVAFGVVAVLVFAGVQGAGRPRWQDILLVAAVLSASFGYAEGTRIAREIGGWQVIAWALVATAPLIVPFVVVDLPGRSWEAPWSAWLGLAYVSLVSMFLGFVFWYRGLALGGTARVGQAQLAQPVLTLLWSALLLGEHVGPAEVVTGAFVVASVLLTRRFRSPWPPPAG